MKKKEFSKIIFHVVITLYIIIMIFCMALLWRDTENSSNISYIITSITTLATTTIGFYFWKAKMENMIKLSKKSDKTIGELKEIESNMTDYDITNNDI